MRAIAEAWPPPASPSRLPRLPGHGTTVEDMNTTSWADWTAEVEAAYERLADRCEHVVVMGLSMGGTLTAWIGAEHPDIAGLVFINAAAERSDEMRAGLQAMLDGGEEDMDGIGSRRRRPRDHRVGLRPRRRSAPLVSMLDGVADAPGPPRRPSPPRR